MLSVCESFVGGFNIQFNEQKSKCMLVCVWVEEFAQYQII